MLPSFSSLQEECLYWSQRTTQLETQLAETQARHDEFIEESKLLEEELEKDAETAETHAKTAKRLADNYAHERDQWKEKFHEEKIENTKSLTKLQDLLDKVSGERDALRIRTRDLEQQNDDLERHEREITSSLQDLEIKLTSAMERTALLESEIENNATLSDEIQRLRDELRDQSHELSVLKSREQKNNNNSSEDAEDRVLVQKSDASTNTCIISSLHEEQPPPNNTPRTAQRRNTIEGENPFYSSSLPTNSAVNFGIPLTSKTTAALSPSVGVGKIGVSRSTNHQSTTTNGANNPVNMVREMLGRVKMLESRLISCRSLVTPLLTPSPRRQARRDSVASVTSSQLSGSRSSTSSTSGLAYMTLAAVNNANSGSGNDVTDDGSVEKLRDIEIPTDVSKVEEEVGDKKEGHSKGKGVD